MNTRTRAGGNDPEPGSPQPLLARVTGWARLDRRVEGLALIGSHARDQARTKSDIDLLVLSPVVASLLADRSWLHVFGEVDQLATEPWGDVTSLRVWYHDGPEVEFAIAAPSWARPPVDSGKRRVLAGGFRILIDKTGALAQLAPGEGHLP